MRITQLHKWDVAPREAMKLQDDLKKLVKKQTDASLQNLQKIAGVDVSIKDRSARAAVVIVSKDMQALEEVVEEEEVKFPYIPGLLAFRECPCVLKAFERIKNEPDLIIIDGQGLAHPRRFGIACHLGVILDKPSIGCAKTNLTGEFEHPDEEAASYTPLIDKGEIIGAVLRTRKNVAPVFVSIGHRISLEDAIKIVLNCCRGYRLPEPIRFAHQVAGGQSVVKNVRQSSLFELKDDR